MRAGKFVEGRVGYSVIRLKRYRRFWLSIRVRWERSVGLDIKSWDVILGKFMMCFVVVVVVVFFEFKEMIGRCFEFGGRSDMRC